jgi:ribosomal protein S18 acetylase RimI-like enzyme
MSAGEPIVSAVGELIEPRLEQVTEFCAREPVERVFMEDVARRGLGKFAALEDGDGRLRALCHLGANVAPAGEECGAFARLLDPKSVLMIIGEQGAVDALWAEGESRVRPPREDRPGQPVYRIDEAPEPGGTGLRAATLADLERLVPACAAAHEEELGYDPLLRDERGFRWRTRAQIEQGRSWVWLEDGVILFKAEASAWTPAAVQLQQVWVDAEVRGRGYASRGLRDLCRVLLERTPTVCLFVRAENTAAIRLYDSIGMRHVLDYRSLVF